MSSQQLQAKFELIAKHLFTYFQRTNFQTRTSEVRKKRIVYIQCFFVFFLKNVADTFSLAGHHNNREFSVDFYYNGIRISTDLKRNGNEATLKMEVRRISLNQKR
jgi:hypothetical protein